MISRIVRVIFLIFSVFSLYAGELPFDCGKYAFSRLDIKHREHKGMGFDQGYSTVSMFVCPSFKHYGLPFFDARLHVFNNAYIASNLGIGSRFSNKSGSAIFGANFYYDYRNYKSLSSHQAAGGFEFLTRWIDFRLNGYYPFSGQYEASAPSFYGFKGNTLFTQEHIRYSLPSIDTEIGFTLPAPCDEIGLYLSLGSYYLFKQSAINQSVGNTLGGRARLNANPTDYISFGVEYTYDNLFRGRINGFVSFHVPLGSRKLQNSTVKRYPYKKSRCDLYVETMKRKTQPVVRNEIIPFYSKNYINSLNEDFLHFIFVNNQNLAADGIGSGSGTFENPYTTIALAELNSAPNDIIYVFFGSGTTKGYDTGFTFKTNQILTSSALDFSVEPIIIPPFTPGQFPTLTNQNAPVIQAASTNNVVTQGFALKGSNEVVVKASSTGITLLKNNLFGESGFDIFQHINPIGHNLISENTFIGNTASSAGSGSIHLSNPLLKVSESYQISNNSIINDGSQYGLFLEDYFSKISIQNNSIHGNAIGIFATIDTTALSVTTLNISNNTFSIGSSEGISIFNHNNSILHGTISNNTMNASSSGLSIYNDGIESVCLNITGNRHISTFTFTNASNGAIRLPASPTLNIAGFNNLNNPSASTSATNVTFVPPGTPCPPFQAVFVDNSADPSLQNGTFEHPWTTLALAQANSKDGDLIYVFTGDGTTKGYDQGIALKNNQTIAGSGTPFNYKGTTIQPFTSKMPMVTNTLNGSNLITCSDITNFSIFGLNLLEYNNFIGINISNCSGNITIQGNLINSYQPISIMNTTAVSNISIANNNITNIGDSTITLQAIGTCSIDNNILQCPTPFIPLTLKGFELQDLPGTLTLNIANNVFQGYSQSSSFSSSHAFSSLNLTMYNNTFKDNPAKAFDGNIYFNSFNSNLNCTLIGNQFTSIPIDADPSSSANIYLKNEGKSVYNVQANRMAPGGTTAIDIYYPTNLGKACITNFIENNATNFIFSPGTGGLGTAQINTIDQDRLEFFNNPNGTYTIENAFFAGPGTACP